MKNLIIVDVQKEYAKTWGGAYSIDAQYVRNILAYIKKEKFDHVYYIVDCNSGEINIPLLLQSKAAGFFYKNYAGYCLDEIERLVEEGEITVVEKDVAYKDSYEQLILVTDNIHETQTVNEDLERLMMLIKDEENFLIGGCDGECLLDIEKVMDYYEVKYTRENPLIYPIYSPLVSAYDTIEWVNVKCPY